MTHTPGPWRELAPGVIAAVHRDPGWGAIAKVSQADAEPEAQANARLIAAAPTLLAALEQFMSVDILNSSSTWRDAKAQARAAIEATKGDA